MEYADWNHIYLDTVDSTNTYAKKLHADGAREKTLIRAGVQTRGRGRMDRRWESPAGSGLWFTLLFRPEVAPEKAPQLVFCAALAVNTALRALTGGDFMIKWPNDIVINGKKVCGMLSECGFENGELAFAAMGIGINLTADTLPEELIYASGIKEETGCKLAADAFFGTFLPLFDEYIARFEKNGLSSLLGELSENMITLNRQVRVGGREGFAEGLDESGALIVSYSDGSREKLLAGDVSVRGITDYV